MIATNVEINRYIGGRLRQQRLIQGLSDKECAERLAVKVTQLRRYEKGLTRIPPLCLAAAAATFKVSIGWFFEEAPSSWAIAGSNSADADLMRFLALPEAYPLIRRFVTIDSRKRRQAVVDYVGAVAGLDCDQSEQPKCRNSEPAVKGGLREIS